MVLPLRGHDLGVGAGNVDFRVQAGAVVRFDDIASKDAAEPVSAVVGTLRGREAVLGPAVWPAVLVEHGVLLLEAEPEAFVLVLFHELGGIGTEIVLVGRAIGHVRFAHDEDVVAFAPWVGENGAGAQIDVGVVARSLGGGGAVKVPLWELFNANHLVRECLCGLVSWRSEASRDMETELTLDFERVPFELSIQTYSAMILPRWSRSRYLWS